MPEISILIPSLRRGQIKRRIVEFAEANPDVDYEIVVTSPFPVTGNRVVHVMETERRGCLAAMRDAYERASSDIIFYTSDDAAPTPGCLAAMLRFVRSQPEPFIGAFRLIDMHGYELNPWALYDRLYACWGCLSRGTLEKIGGFFDPSLRSFWADPEMSTRCWANDGRVALCPDAYMRILGLSDDVNTQNTNRYFQQDTATFYNKWHAILGNGEDNYWTTINRPMLLASALRHPAPLLAKQRRGETQQSADLTSQFAAPPMVTALVPVCNSRRLMCSLLEDLTNQTVADQLEILVLDYGSEQNEREIVEAFQHDHGRIRYLPADAGDSFYQALNRGVQAAQGKYLTIACPEDRHHVQALERMTQTLERHPEAALVYADVILTPQENCTFVDSGEGGICGFVRPPDFDSRLLTTHNYIGFQPVWRREMHDRFGLFDPTLDALADYEFWLRIAMSSEFIHVQETLGRCLLSPERIVSSLRLPDHKISISILCRRALDDPRLQTIRDRYNLARIELASPPPALESEQAAEWNAAGEAKFNQGDMQGAFADFTRALQENPDFVPVHNNLGVWWWTQGNRQKATQHFIRALELDPHSMDAMRNGVALLAQNQRPEEARQGYGSDNAEVKEALEALLV